MDQMNRRKSFMQWKRLEINAERYRLDDASAAAELMDQQANADRIELLCRDEEKSTHYEQSRVQAMIIATFFGIIFRSFICIIGVD